MFQALKNGDLVITNDKQKILKYLTANKILLNLRIMTLADFKNSYFGTYNEKAIYYLMKKYAYKYENAKLYLDNFLFLPDLKQELIANDLLVFEPLFKENIKRIVVMTPFVDKYILEEIEKYPHVFLLDSQGTYKPRVKAFADMETEVENVAVDILELLKSISIDDISLVVEDSSYEPVIRKIFKLFNIPINIDTKNYIYGLKQVQMFIKKLCSTKSMEEALKVLEEGEVYNKVVAICNKYRFTEVDEVIIEALTEELKLAYLEKEKNPSAINLVSLKDIEENNYYFVLGFNQGTIPRIYKNEDFLSDSKKEKLHILTSLEKNNLERQEVINKITNNPHVFLYYKKSVDNQEVLPSALIQELNLKVSEENNCHYHYSHLFNKLVLAQKLDAFIKFNEKDEDLALLYNNYRDIAYLTYDNSYKQINATKFKQFYPNLVLSYTSLDNFYRCRFRYYLTNILKLNKFEETFMTLIGNIYHAILAKCFTNNFDFEAEYNLLIKDKDFSYKEQFFLEKLKKELKEVIDIIKKQNSYSSLTNNLYEQKVEIKLNNEVNFMGIIDKVVYEEENGQTYLAIIDYKTGNVSPNINNLVYGLDMQLPIYLFLTDYLKFNNPVVVGFYLQKVIGRPLAYQPGKSFKEEREKLYRLNGFSTDKEEALAKLDYDYADSKVIKGMKKSSKGFYAYTKVLSADNLEAIKKMVEDKITAAYEQIKQADFVINPKNIGGELVGCDYCPFKDICYKKEDDEVWLKEQDYHDFLGGEQENVD